MNASTQPLHAAAPVDQSTPAPTASEAAARHVPVMRERIVELLAPALQRPGSIYLDGTLGMGGHAEAMLEAFPQCRVIGIDRDPQALANARARLERFGDRATLVKAVFDELPEVLADRGIPAVDAILLDLGLSSLQIDERERGFAYSVDAPLDMRMDSTATLTAAELVNTWSATDLSRLFRAYGEEPFADRIARRIVEHRETAPFERSGRLVETITAAVPMAARRGPHAKKGHPAKRVFQALRIEVNGELDVLQRVLPASLDAVNLGGRVSVLAYHSLEDRAVKQCFAKAIADSAPPGLPVVPEAMQPRFAAITRGAERPTAQEVDTNPRAASARLRVVERVRESA